MSLFWKDLRRVQEVHPHRDLLPEYLFTGEYCILQYSGVSEVLDAHTTAGLVVPRCQPRVLACPVHASKFQLMRLMLARATAAYVCMYQYCILQYSLRSALEEHEVQRRAAHRRG